VFDVSSALGPLRMKKGQCQASQKYIMYNEERLNSLECFSSYHQLLLISKWAQVPPISFSSNKRWMWSISSTFNSTIILKPILQTSSCSHFRVALSPYFFTKRWILLPTSHKECPVWLHTHFKPKDEYYSLPHKECPVWLYTHFKKTH
jgi:hypothetical protein